MKKLRRFSVLALFALSFALVLGGCKNSTSSEEDQTLTPPSNDGDEDDSKAEAVTIVKKGEYKVKVDNEHSQAIVSMTGTDKAITVGDLLIVGGTVSVNENTPIGQVYLKIGGMQFTGFWDEKATAATNDYYAVYRATEAQDIGVIQIAALKAGGEGKGVSVLPEDTEITLKNFYIMRLPAANLDELAPGVFKATYTLAPNPEATDNMYGYESILDIAPAVAVKQGDLLYASYSRPAVSQDYKPQYFQFVDGDSDGWSKGSGWQACYQSKDAGAVTLTYKAKEAFSWNKTQIGIQQQSSSKPEKGLEITNLSLRLLPSF